MCVCLCVGHDYDSHKTAESIDICRLRCRHAGFQRPRIRWGSGSPTGRGTSEGNIPRQSIYSKWFARWQHTRRCACLPQLPRQLVRWPTRLLKAGLRLCSASVSYLVIYFERFPSDQLSENLPVRLPPNFPVGWAVAVDDQREISFSIPQGPLPWQPIFVGFIHRTDFRHASGSWRSRAG